MDAVFIRESAINTDRTPDFSVQPLNRDDEVSGVFGRSVAEELGHGRRKEQDPEQERAHSDGPSGDSAAPPTSYSLGLAFAELHRSSLRDSLRGVTSGSCRMAV